MSSGRIEFFCRRMARLPAIRRPLVNQLDRPVQDIVNNSRARRREPTRPMKAKRCSCALAFEGSRNMARTVLAVTCSTMIAEAEIQPAVPSVMNDKAIQPVLIPLQSGKTLDPAYRTHAVPT